MKLAKLFLCSCLAATLAACATPQPRGANGAQVGNSARLRTDVRPVDWANLRSSLSRALSGTPGVEIGDMRADGLKLQIPVADGFAPGRTELRSSLARTLDALVPALAPEAEAAIHIVGHTDSQGSEMHNLQLSIARAEAVAEYLRGRGIALDRLSADGRGEADPLTSNAQESGRMRNRRIELILKPMP
ncbi:MAG: OmpA family protein [Thauera sp.]|nr:OmpA family protein [Thauera sp.]